MGWCIFLRNAILSRIWGERGHYGFQNATRLYGAIDDDLLPMGEPDGFVAKFLDQLAMIRAAPRPHIVFIGLAAGGIWWAMDWKYSADIVHRDAKIKLVTAQRDDYKEKLGGASPDQAKARMDALEKRLAQIEPRRLTEEQRAKLLFGLARQPTNTTIQIAHDGTCADCSQYAADFNAIFSAAGWHTLTPATFLGLNVPRSPKGLTLFISDFAPERALLMQALEAAAIPFDVMRGPGPGGLPSPIASILITARVAL